MTNEVTCTVVKFIKIPVPLSEISRPGWQGHRNWNVYRIKPYNNLGVITWDKYDEEYRFVPLNARGISFNEVALREIAGFISMIGLKVELYELDERMSTGVVYFDANPLPNP